LNYFQEREWEEERKIERETERKKGHLVGSLQLQKYRRKWQRYLGKDETGQIVKRKEKHEQGPGGEGGGIITGGYNRQRYILVSPFSWSSSSAPSSSSPSREFFDNAPRAFGESRDGSDNSAVALGIIVLVSDPLQWQLFCSFPAVCYGISTAAACCCWFF
jgi:hypothetical protein